MVRHEARDSQVWSLSTSGELETSPQPGEEAPDFELRDQHGQAVRLSSYRGVSRVLLVFYPFAFTRVNLRYRPVAL